MNAATRIIPRLARVGLVIGAAMPAMALAHGSDHLHYWGSHTAEGQGMLLGGALLALVGIGLWLRSRRG